MQERDKETRKLTGRELFLMDKTLNESDLKFLEDGKFLYLIACLSWNLRKMLCSLSLNRYVSSSLAISVNLLLPPMQEMKNCSLCSQKLWSEFLATDPEVPGSIPGITRFSEK
jgi:hypothetical protein